MDIRYYILPIVEISDGGTNVEKGPKYFANWGKFPKTGIICRFGYQTFGLINQCIVKAEIEPADHDALVLNSDVLAIPINIDNTLTTGAVNTAQTFLETYGIPAGWITASQTYRDVLRTICGFFQYVQAVTGILGTPITLTGGALNTQIKNVPLATRNAMAQAASQMGFDYSAVTPNTTVRQVLKAMADAWGDTPVNFQELGPL